MSITTPEAIVGNAGIVAKLAIGVAAAVEYSGNIKEVKIDSEDKDDSDLTFAEAIAGDTKDYKVTIKALASTAVGSFWRLLWDNPGEEFAFTYGPHGNAVATADKPHFLMTLKADGRPPVGNTARRSKDREEFEYTLEVLDGPTLDDGA
jgi:hypothetical protein